ncbi:MAG: NERD domain-containing protein [Oscillospiraceae bacterium]|nr:NERD domain-containing protein [Oscillospiraceae bacterium]
MLIFIIILFFLVLKLKKYLKYKKITKIGETGEALVNEILSSLNPKKYFVLNNIILEHPNKRTSQVDHIIISRKAIFVIETKNYSGVLFGNIKNRYWLHISGKNKHSVYNIAAQNQGHINAIKNNINNILLNNISYRKYKKFFVSVLLFKNNCKVKIKKPLFYNLKSKKIIICNFGNLVKIIKKTRRRNVISKKLYKEIISEITNNNLSSKKKLKSHIKQIRKYNNIKK